MQQKLKIAVGLFIAFAVIAGFAASDRDTHAIPIVNTVEPPSGRAGDILKATGVYLDKSFVQELYLTDGKVDLKTEIVEQKTETIRFKIPAATKAGRYHLMLLTAAATPLLLEEGAMISVIEDR